MGIGRWRSISRSKSGEEINGPLAISLRAARLVYSGLALFDGLDLELAGGSFTCLLGPSGIGKSSLLRLLAGLTSPGISGELLWRRWPVAHRTGGLHGAAGFVVALAERAG